MKKIERIAEEWARQNNYETMVDSHAPSYAKGICKGLEMAIERIEIAQNSPAMNAIYGADIYTENRYYAAMSHARGIVEQLRRELEDDA